MFPLRQSGQLTFCLGYSTIRLEAKYLPIM